MILIKKYNNYYIENYYYNEDGKQLRRERRALKRKNK